MLLQDNQYQKGSGKSLRKSRVLSVVDGIATMELWNPNNKFPKRVPFKLSVKFLNSQRCFWKKVALTGEDNGEN